MRDATIVLPWADADHTFRLAWGELEMLQEACDAGPYVILNRLHDGTWRMRDISATIRLGLIGGGMTPADALKLVRAYVEARPPLENVIFAQGILGAGVMGAPDEELGKKKMADNGETIDSLPNGKVSFAPIYGNCAAMGFSPQEARKMSIWQYVAAVEGFTAANDPDAGKRLSETDADALFAWITEA